MKYLDIFIIIYLDDIFIYSKILEKYIRHVRRIFNKKNSEIYNKKRKMRFL